MTEEIIEYVPIPLDAAESVASYFETKYGRAGMQKIRPLRDLVLCRCADSKPKQSPGGVLLAEQSRGRDDTAEVLAVGNGRVTSEGVRVPPGVKPGDVIMFDPYQLAWVEGQHGNTPHAKPHDLFLVREEAIHGVVDHGEAQG